MGVPALRDHLEALGRLLALHLDLFEVLSRGACLERRTDFAVIAAFVEECRLLATADDNTEMDRKVRGITRMDVAEERSKSGGAEGIAAQPQQGC